MNIEIEKINGLEKQSWSFWLRDTTLILTSYYIAHKESSAKRTYKVSKIYDRIFSRNSTMKKEEVPLPETIIQEAKDILISKLTVTKD